MNINTLVPGNIHQTADTASFS